MTNEHLREIYDKKIEKLQEEMNDLKIKFANLNGRITIVFSIVIIAVQAVFKYLLP